MFFIRVGTFVAWATVIFGLFRFAAGMFVALVFEGDSMFAASRRYLAAADSGEAIGEGIMIFLAGITLGVVVEIAKGRRS